MEILKKEELRKIHIEKRKKMSFLEKEKKDLEIFQKLINLECFINFEVILSYVSFEFEVDTIDIIKYCFKKNKKIYTPVCCKNKNNINFYLINSFEELHLRCLTNFLLLEPKEKRKNIFENVLSKNTICVIPGICYSIKGDRIGFGKGYYDRFLKNFKGIKIGICYDFNLEQKFITNSLDIPVDILITEKQTIFLKKFS